MPQKQSARGAGQHDGGAMANEAAFLRHNPIELRFQSGSFGLSQSRSLRASSSDRRVISVSLPGF